MSLTRICFPALVLLTLLAGTTNAEVVIDWVTVGNPGNDPHSSGYGSVAKVYRIGKYEVTNSQYAEFVNAVAAYDPKDPTNPAATDPNGLYNNDMGGGWNDIGGISRSGSGTQADPWVYSARTNRGNRPVNYVSWYDTLRFTNWLHNGQPGLDTPVGQDDNSTEDGAYDMSLGTGVVRKGGATVFLPTEDEWHKPAYHKNDGVTGNYWHYPTESDSVPTNEAPPGSDLVNGSANYYSGGYLDTTYYTNEVGAYDTMDGGEYVSDSPYGTFDQGGNVLEWNETALFGDLTFRGFRGSSFDNDYNGLRVYAYSGNNLTFEFRALGFRVASIPEPGCITLLVCGVVAGLLASLWRRRRRD